MARPEELQIYDQTNILSHGRLLVVFTALSVALLITSIDQQSIGVILPAIGEDLKSSSTITWAATSSLIASTAFQVLYGRLSDIFGRKVMLISCLCLLGVGNLLCSFAKTGPQLFAFRGISGVASGGAMALCLMIVTDITTLQQSGKLMGIIGANIAFGAMIGPYMASGFTQSVTWRALFWLLCPLSLSTALALYFLLPRQVIPPEPLKNKLVKIDYVGILLSSSGTILLLVPISGINTEWSVSSPWVIAMFTLGSFFLFLFVLNEWKLARLPMFPLRLFKNPALAAVLVQSFLIGISYYSIFYYVPMFCETVRGMSPTESATWSLAILVPQAVASISSGQYMSRTNRYGEIIWLGFSLWVIAATLETRFSRDFPPAAMAAALVMQGLGLGFTFQPTFFAAQAHACKADRAIVISSRNFLRYLGGACGLAIASTLFSNTLVGNLPSPPFLPENTYHKIISSVFTVPDLSGLSDAQKDVILEVYTNAARSVFYLWVGCTSMCWLLMFLLKDHGLQRTDENEATAPPVEVRTSHEEEEGRTGHLTPTSKDYHKEVFEYTSELERQPS